MNYYLLLSDSTVQSFECVNSIDLSVENTLILYADEVRHEISLKEVIIHGDEEYWLQIMELFRTIDRLTNKMVKGKLQKAVSLGYLAGLLTV